MRIIETENNGLRIDFEYGDILESDKEYLVYDEQGTKLYYVTFPAEVMEEIKKGLNDENI